MTAELKITMVSIGDLIPTPDNPRIIRPKDQSMRDLAESVKSRGILEPLLGRPHPTKKGKIDLRAGARRLAAAEMAGLETVPVIVREMTDQEALEVTVTENLQREDLTSIESARGVASLIAGGWTVKEIAEHIGKAATWVVRHARIAELSPAIRKALEDGKAIAQFPAGWLELIARLPQESQEHWRQDNGSYMPDNQKELERSLAQYTNVLDAAPWAKDDGTLTPPAPACAECVKRSSRSPGLFDEWDGVAEVKPDRNDKCLDQTCWKKKGEAFAQRKIAEVRAAEPKAVMVVGDRGGTCGKPHGAVSEWQVEKCKQTAKGAVKCVVISGEHAGQTYWGKARYSGEKLARAAGAGKPKSMAERRAGLAKRRGVMLLGLVQEALGKIHGAPRTPGAAALVAAFGTEDNAMHHAFCRTVSPWAVLPKMRKASDIDAALWKRVEPVIEQRLQYAGQGSVQIDEARNVCKLFGIDIKALLKLCEEEIPEPRSWANLKSDGTAKGTDPDGEKRTVCHCCAVSLKIKNAKVEGDHFYCRKCFKKGKPAAKKEAGDGDADGGEADGDAGGEEEGE